jgi:acyl-coenzyme A synthetase/AMP-(fatty) acid ligase
VIRQLEALPLTPNGKIDRNLLKKWYEENKH